MLRGLRRGGHDVGARGHDIIPGREIWRAVDVRGYFTRDKFY